MDKERSSELSVALEDPCGNFNPVLPIAQNGYNVTWHLPEKIGVGYFTSTYLPSGLSLTVSQCRLKNGLHAHLEASTNYYTLVFNLKGHSLNKNTCFKQGVEMVGGFNYLYCFPDPELAREAAKGELLETVVLTFPKEKLASFSTTQNINNSIWSEEFCFQKNRNSRTVMEVLRQLLHCPFQGDARQFFLEAKALELIALKLDMIVKTPSMPDDMDNIQIQGVLAAKDLLIKKIQKPPSIHDLAKVSGMSHPRLGVNFKRVFGCSPFEFLRRKRLQLALEMVEANEMSLSEIAYEAGYSNASHFSKAFLERYGVQPSQYRKSRTGNPFYSLPGSEI